MRVLFIAALLLGGCKDSGVELRVGVKSFTEQRIVGEMIRARLQAERLPVARLIECGNTADCQRAMASGDVDIVVEYTGTAAAFAAEPGADDFDRIATVMGARGQTWVAPLGFDNGYRVLMAPGGPRTAADLADLAEFRPLRVVAPAEFLKRPRDGLGALATRYGLTLAPRPLLIESPVERFSALRDGRGDVAIGYATDGAIDDFQLVTLRDSLQLFPRYDAAVVVRTDRLDARLRGTLEPLRGRISLSAMRRMNAAVELEGMRPAAVARRFLARQGLLSRDAIADQSAPPLIIAADPVFAKTARDIARDAFPSRAVRVLDTDPRTAVPGKARLAVLPADVLAETRSLVATAVIGRTWIHALRRTGEGLDGRLGVERSMGAAQRGRATMVASAPELLAALRDGRLDVVLIRAPLKDPGIVDALASGLRLVSNDLTAPLHQRARIAANTYAGQTMAIETVSTQVLLAGPGRQRLAQASGPSGAVGRGAAPLTAAQRAAIVRAAGVPELPDPALRIDDTPAKTTQRSGWLDGLLNLLVVCFLAWWVRVLLAPGTEDAEQS